LGDRHQDFRQRRILVAKTNARADTAEPPKPLAPATSAIPVEFIGIAAKPIASWNPSFARARLSTALAPMAALLELTMLAPVLGRYREAG
jgi:hypothetical protein